MWSSCCLLPSGWDPPNPRCFNSLTNCLISIPPKSSSILSFPRIPGISDASGHLEALPVMVSFPCPPGQIMVHSYSIKYEPGCCYRVGLLMWLISMISWFYGKEINLIICDPISAKALRAKLVFPKGEVLFQNCSFSSCLRVPVCWPALQVWDLPAPGHQLDPKT